MQYIMYFCLLSLFFPFMVAEEEEYDFRKEAHAIADTAMFPIAKKHDLRLVGIGGGMFRDIEKVTYRFDIYRKISKQEGREMIVELVEAIAKNFNDNEEIKPYLHDDIVTVKNIDIAIFVHDEKGNSTHYPDLGLVSTFRTDVRFRTYDPEPSNLNYKTDESEPYEETKRMVQEGKDV